MPHSSHNKKIQKKENENQGDLNHGERNVKYVSVWDTGLYRGLREWFVPGVLSARLAPAPPPSLLSPVGGALVLQQQHHQAFLQAEQLAAVRLPQRGGQPAAQRPQAGPPAAAAAGDVEQRVEQLQPQVAVGVPGETVRAFNGRFHTKGTYSTLCLFS